MRIYVENSGNKSNYISFNKFCFMNIPYLAIYNYFLISRENLYFLILSIFQLSTYSKIGFLPSEWSPSGPFSTTIPLVLCFLLEIFSLVFSYVTDSIKTYRYNYHKYVKRKDNKKIVATRFKNISIGDLIIIEPGEIFPVDGLLIKTYSDKYGKINLSNLNGECDTICKDPIKKIVDTKINDLKILKIHDYSSSIKNFSAVGIINNKQYDITHDNFIPGGAINSGNDKVLFMVTEIGKNIRSYTSLSKDRIFKGNFINYFISDGLTKYFVPLLGIFCISLVGFSIIHTRNLNILFIIEKIMQSWILLNGIVPFSIKILLIMNRNIQSYLYSNSDIEYINITSAENLKNVSNIICDKTGTITKNQLLLTHLSYKNTIYQKDDIDKTLPFDYIGYILFGLHIKDNTYNTEEDRVIGHRILSFGTEIKYSGKEVLIKSKNNSTRVEIIEMNRLEFDCDRKLSSVIFKILESNEIHIVTKGSIDSIKKIISSQYMDRYIDIEDQYNKDYPYLRTIAFCIKKLENYDKSIDPKAYESSKDYKFLSILGIQDELQENINETIEYLKNIGKTISICTGDRKETALYISDDIGILGEGYFTFNDHVVIKNIKNSSFIFSSCDITNSLKDYDSIKRFKNYLINSKNFIAYSLTPKDKKYITNIFEAHNINTISIGDGTNDIPMLNTSTVAIGINNGLNNNVINNSDISIKKFKDLRKVSSDITNFVNINLRTSFMVYYKTLLINSLLYFYILFNKLDFGNILFGFIDIQGHHILWGLLPMITANFTIVNKINQNIIIKTASLYGIINSSVVLSIVYNYGILPGLNLKTLILFMTILSINIQFILIYGFNKLNIISSIFSLSFGILYILSTC